jgi:dihydrolipoamide dehydrogenase
MSEKFDLIVIGGGPGGYVCAIRAAQLGLKSACVESRGTLGGTCLNVGCIPSKSLLNLSENFNKVQNQFNEQGIEVSNVKLNVAKMMKNKEKSVQTLTKGVEFLFKKNKVTYLKGKGVIFSPNDVVVYNEGKKSSYKTTNIVIATGSSPTSLPGIKIDEKNIISSTAALSLNEVPKLMVIIGGGYIGLEMGSVWKRLGSKIIVIENLPFITPGMDREVSKEFQKILSKQGIEFKLNSKVLSIRDAGSNVEIEFEDNIKKTKEKIVADKALIAVGRKPFTEGLNLSKIGVVKD